MIDVGGSTLQVLVMGLAVQVETKLLIALLRFQELLPKVPVAVVTPLEVVQ